MITFYFRLILFIWRLTICDHINDLKTLSLFAYAPVSLTLVMAQSHCQKSSPEPGRIDHSCWIRGLFLVIPANSCEFE